MNEWAAIIRIIDVTTDYTSGAMISKYDIWTKYLWLNPPSMDMTVLNQNREYSKHRNHWGWTGGEETTGIETVNTSTLIKYANLVYNTSILLKMTLEMQECLQESLHRTIMNTIQRGSLGKCSQLLKRLHFPNMRQHTCTHNGGIDVTK